MFVNWHKGLLNALLNITKSLAPLARGDYGF